MSEGSSLAGWAGCIHGMCGYSDLGAAASAEGGWGSPLCDLAPVLVVTVLAWEGQGEEGSLSGGPASCSTGSSRAKAWKVQAVTLRSSRKGVAVKSALSKAAWGGGVCELLWGVLSGADAATGPGDGPQGHAPGSRAGCAGGLGPLTPELCPL